MKNNFLLIRLIFIVSILIPLAVAFLLFIPQKLDFFGKWAFNIPHVNAVINSLTSLILLYSLYMIRIKNIRMHKFLMSTAFVLGSIFLVLYIIYHSSVESTSYVGNNKQLYYFFLISHISLSIVVVPFVLFAFYYSLTNQIIKHQKIVKFTFPIWLYVSTSGVIVYYMISPFYSQL
tara:strand:- start:131 stop:658 length:528 start_codon:yes stop_codon:yes gene_type:complete